MLIKLTHFLTVFLFQVAKELVSGGKRSMAAVGDIKNVPYLDKL